MVRARWVESQGGTNGRIGYVARFRFGDRGGYVFSVNLGADQMIVAPEIVRDGVLLCPKCDEGMRYIPNHDFYGCNDYPGCNGTRQHDIVTDEEGEALFYFHVVRIANS